MLWASRPRKWTITRTANCGHSFVIIIDHQQPCRPDRNSWWAAVNLTRRINKFTAKCQATTLFVSKVCTFWVDLQPLGINGRVMSNVACFKGFLSLGVWSALGGVGLHEHLLMSVHTDDLWHTRWTERQGGQVGRGHWVGVFTCNGLADPQTVPFPYSDQGVVVWEWTVLRLPRQTEREGRARKLWEENVISTTTPARRPKGPTPNCLTGRNCWNRTSHGRAADAVSDDEANRAASVCYLIGWRIIWSWRSKFYQDATGIWSC